MPGGLKAGKLEGWNTGRPGSLKAWRLECRDAGKSHIHQLLTFSLRIKLELMMFHARNQNIELKRSVRQKLWMIQSFFPTSAFRLPNSRLRIPTFVIIFIIFASWISWAGETANEESGTLTASLDQASVPVGGVVWLTLDYRLPEGGRLPEKLEVNGLDDLSVLKQDINPGQIRIQLLVDQIGQWQSEPIGLTYLDEQDQKQLLTTQPISIQAVSNLGEKAEEAELRPIRDIVPVTSIWQRYLLWLAAIVALALIGLGLFWWYKRRGKPAGPAEYTEPPDVRARRELLGLETKQYFDKGRVKKHYFVFSEILRRYLEAIRNFPAAEYTTEEIARHISAEPDRKLIPLLQQADLVKFADIVPTRNHKEEDIKAALAYIRKTGPQPKTVLEQAQQRKEQR
jgi:hypothetical protein